MHRTPIASLFLGLALVSAHAADAAPLDTQAVQGEIGQRAQSLTDAIATLEKALADTRAQLAAAQTTSEADKAALAQAEVALTAARAQLASLQAQMVQPASKPGAEPQPRPQSKLTPASTFRELKPGDRVTLAGQTWAAQTPRIKSGSDGSFVFPAKAGERADFDPPRKIRTELVGLRQYAKGEEIILSGTFNLAADSVFTGTEWCSIVQIHQADTKRADGIYVNASPMFSMDILPGPGGKPFLQVRGETGRGEQTTFSPTRILGKLPDLELGKDHTFKLIVVDGHGGPGRISVWVDGKAVVDRADIATGYEYVDLLANAYPIKGKPQPTTSYLKAGIYAGKASGDAPPSAFSVGLTLKNLSAR